MITISNAIVGLPRNAAMIAVIAISVVGLVSFALVGAAIRALIEGASQFVELLTLSKHDDYPGNGRMII